MKRSHTGSYIEQYPVRLGARGRIVLPATVRERLGLHDGDELLLIVQSDGMVRRAGAREQARKGRGMFARKDSRHLVKELIQERRREART